MSASVRNIHKKNNKITMMQRPKYVTRMMRPWNDRFHVMVTKDNNKLHLYYKELFGKPSHKKHEEVLLHDKGVDQNMFTASYAPMSSTTTSKFMRRSQSQEQVQVMTKEQQWVSNFAVMGSKNNDIVHRHYQEYFDRPVEYDNQGYKQGIKQFGEVYETISPSKYSHLARTMGQKSVNSLKHYNSRGSQFTRDAKETSPEPMKEGEGEGDEEEENKKSDKKIENSKTIQNAIRHHRRKVSKRRNLKRSIESLNNRDPNIDAGIPTLRGGQKQSPLQMKRELGWRKVGDPISTLNEKVFKAYRIGFDRL